MQELIKALIKARQSFQPITKDRTNPHYKSKYATLDSVLTAVTEGLAKHGLVVTQTMRTDGESPILVSTLWHESGESLESCYPIPMLSDPQKLGSAITYARRYSLCALLNVSADEDDDGNGALDGNKPQQAQSKVAPIKAPVQKPGCINEAQRKRLFALSAEAGFSKDALKAMLITAGFESSRDITIARYDEVCGFAQNPKLAQQWNEHIAQKVAS